MKKIITTAFVLLLLVGCDSGSKTITDNEPNNKTTKIWNNTSQRIVITRNNGNVPIGEDQYTEYDFSLDTLTSDALLKISNIETTLENLFCSNDGITYEINITDENGILLTYVSNNRDCGKENESLFIETSSITSIIDSL